MKRHLSRLASPKIWPIERKEIKWIAKPRPGPHSMNNSITLNILLQNVLNIAKNTKESRRILNKGNVKVDGIIRKDHKFPTGMMDVVSIKDDNYRILLDKKGRFILHKISKEESNLKPKKIVKKTTLKKKKIQITFFDGTNKIIDKDNYKVADTLILDLSKKSVKDHLKLEEGNLAYLLSGKHAGELGIIKRVETNKDLKPNKIFLSKNKESFETLKDYAFVIGKTKPVISLPQ